MPTVILADRGIAGNREVPGAAGCDGNAFNIFLK